MKKNIECLPCIICNKSLTNVGHDNRYNQPNEGVVFYSRGNYGSTVYDQLPYDREELVINICDECLKLKSEHLRVYEVTAETKIEHTYKFWSPDA